MLSMIFMLAEFSALPLELLPFEAKERPVLKALMTSFADCFDAKRTMFSN